MDINPLIVDSIKNEFLPIGIQEPNLLNTAGTPVFSGIFTPLDSLIWKSQTNEFHLFPRKEDVQNSSAITDWATLITHLTPPIREVRVDNPDPAELNELEMLEVGFDDFTVTAKHLENPINAFALVAFAVPSVSVVPSGSYGKRFRHLVPVVDHHAQVLGKVGIGIARGSGNE
jgi:hypothetical protein